MFVILDSFSGRLIQQDCLFKVWTQRKQPDTVVMWRTFESLYFNAERFRHFFSVSSSALRMIVTWFHFYVLQINSNSHFLSVKLISLWFWNIWCFFSCTSLLDLMFNNLTQHFQSYSYTNNPVSICLHRLFSSNRETNVSRPGLCWILHVNNVLFL